MKKSAFTLAETLIVIGIIGVVAALTLPNLNHATGDKETVTRLMKAYSMLNEANDRAVATYGPVSTWTEEKCGGYGVQNCWLKRIEEFLKVSKKCDVTPVAEDAGTYSSCDSLKIADLNSSIIIQQADGITFLTDEGIPGCAYTYGNPGDYIYFNDICINGIYVDINGPTKGKNDYGHDVFEFALSDSLGVIPYDNPDSCNTLADIVNTCMEDKTSWMCTWWVIEHGNLDYLKADEEGKCNDNPSIILDGVNNTSCH